MSTPEDLERRIKELEMQLQRFHIASLELADASLELVAIGLNSEDQTVRAHSNRAFDAVSKAIKKLGASSE